MAVRCFPVSSDGSQRRVEGATSREEAFEAPSEKSLPRLWIRQTTWAHLQCRRTQTCRSIAALLHQRTDDDELKSGPRYRYPDYMCNQRGPQGVPRAP